MAARDISRHGSVRGPVGKILKGEFCVAFVRRPLQLQCLPIDRAGIDPIVIASRTACHSPTSVAAAVSSGTSGGGGLSFLAQAIDRRDNDIVADDDMRASP